MAIEAADDEEAPAMFFDRGAMDARGDEEVGEVWTTECTGGGFQAGDGNAVEFVTGSWVEARDTAAMAECDPEVAICIDGHAVWGSLDVGGVDDAARVGELAIEVIERKDFAFGGVDIESSRGVGRPDNAIGSGDRAVGFVD